MEHLSPTSNQSITILKKPVMAISEDEKNAIKAAIDKWAIEAKAHKVNKPTRYIAERDKLLVECFDHDIGRYQYVGNYPLFLAANVFWSMRFSSEKDFFEQMASYDICEETAIQA